MALISLLVTTTLITAFAAADTRHTTLPLSVIAEPQAGVAPFLQMIDGAHSSIELTMYELYDRRVESALVAAAARHVDVRVLLNADYYGRSDNAAAYSYLDKHGVHVRWADRTYLVHQKTLTVDGRESAIMTLNFDGEYSTTRDLAILDRQPADIAAVVDTFDADWRDDAAYETGSGAGDLIWSPGSAYEVVLQMIGGATHTIDLENEEMAYHPATNALCAAAKRGVRVRVVMTADSEWDTALNQLRACGVSVGLYHGQSYYIHAKLLIIDGRIALVSSQNLSTASLEYNRELGIRLTSPAIVAALTRDFASDYAGVEPS